MKKIKIGVIGTGHIASVHIANIKKNKKFILVGVFGANEERLAVFANKWGVRYYTKYSDFLNLCDAVLIANLPGDHLKFALEAAEAGKHLLVEKPIGTDLDKTLKLIEICKQKKLKLAVDFQCRAVKQIQFVKNLFDRKRFGDPFYGYVNVDWAQSGSYYKLHQGRDDVVLAGGGVLINQAIHYIDLALLFIDSEIVEVKSFCDTKKHNTNLEDTGAAIVKFKNGFLLSIVASNACYNKSENKVAFFAKEGSLAIVNGKITRLEFKKRNMREKIYYKVLSVFFKTAKNNFGNYEKMIDNFYNSIIFNEKLIADGIDGYNSLWLAQAIYENKNKYENTVSK